MIYFLLLLILVPFSLLTLLTLAMCSNKKDLGKIFSSKIGMFLFQKTKEYGVSFYTSKKEMVLNQKKFFTNQFCFHIFNSQMTFISNNLIEKTPEPILLGVLEGNKWMEREQRRQENSSSKEVAKYLKNVRERHLNYQVLEESKLF